MRRNLALIARSMVWEGVAVAGGQGESDEQQRSIEAAVSAIAAGAPSDWVSLHAEFALTKATATVDTESGDEAAPLEIPPEALQDIASHQRCAVTLGEPWQRLIVDCDRSGELSVSAVPAGGSAARVRRVLWVLLALAALLIVASVAVYVATSTCT